MTKMRWIFQVIASAAAALAISEPLLSPRPSSDVEQSAMLVMILCFGFSLLLVSDRWKRHRLPRWAAAICVMAVSILAAFGANLLTLEAMSEYRNELQAENNQGSTPELLLRDSNSDLKAYVKERAKEAPARRPLYRSRMS